MRPAHETDPFRAGDTYAVGALTCVVFFYLHFVFRERYNIPLKNDEFGARINSLIHAFLSAVGCGYALWHHDGGWFDSPATRTEANWQMFTFMYFAVDTVIMIMWEWSTVYFAHHMITLSVCGCPALFGTYGFCACMATFLGELTNPLMHARWLVRAYYPKTFQENTLFIWLTRLWFVSFGALRFFVGPWLVYEMNRALPLAFSPLCIGILVFSWKFFVDAVRAELKGEQWDV